MNRLLRAHLMCKQRSRFVRPAAMAAVGVFAFSASYACLYTTTALAQAVETVDIFGDAPSVPDEQLLLESDDLTFDSDRSLVIATGNVQIAFGRTTLVADRVEYNQQSGRVIASGNVEILEPNGNRIFAEEIDVTDDFRDGFVDALNVQTPDNTRIAAESAERRDGQLTQFNNGVYTPCLPCKENPEKPPFWQIRAKTVTLNNDTRTVEYEDASLEFFGRPVARLSRFSHADPAIKRKSGFLIPEFGERENLGFSYRQGYFFNLAPDHDFTVWGTYYAQQGFLGEAEWRQRLANGEYSIRYAGLNQLDPDAFDVGTIDNVETDRHAVVTNGLFNLNSRWQFGWNALFQTDDNFARTYNIAGKDDRDITNNIYLTGLGEKNFFDFRAEDYLVQDNLLDSNPGTTLPGNQSFTDQQATVLPLLDYNAVSGEEFQTGQFSLDVNIASISRGAPQVDNFDSFGGAPAANERFHGVEGIFTRGSAEIEWKGSTITNAGAVVTASLSARGDAIFQDSEAPGSLFNPLTSNESIFRFMPAGMLEIRYPLIAQGENVSQIFEPIAQVIARPDETNIGDFVNEDAQSLVFDTTNLFERDKFSGYDRVEGGTRANVGFRYAASFAGSGNINIVAGQSFHLAGDNSFADTSDLVNVGTESGLETDRSDYVASLQTDNGQGFSAGVGVRLDEADLGLRRAEVSARIVKPDYSLTGSYAFIEAQPNSRAIITPETPVVMDRHEFTGSGSLRLDENWRVFGSVTYDIENQDVVRNSVGLRYDNDCFSFGVSYSDLNSDFTGTSSDRSINFSLGLRTIGGFQRSFQFDDETN